MLWYVLKYSNNLAFQARTHTHTHIYANITRGNNRTFIIAYTARVILKEICGLLHPEFQYQI
jgi:hypothetical protein